MSLFKRICCWWFGHRYDIRPGVRINARAGKGPLCSRCGERAW